MKNIKNSFRTLLQALIMISLIFLLSSCQYYYRPKTPTPTRTPLVYATLEPIQWVTMAPMTTHTPTPTIPPLRVIPKGRIAFQSEKDGNREIYLVNADGTNLTRLTNNPAVDVFPSWSPDGSQLLFCSDRNGNPDIYLVNADGTNLRQITNHPAEDALPAWSPDGRRVAFTSNRIGNDEIYVMNLGGSDLKQLTNNSAMDAFPAWSPDGSRIAFTSDRDVNFEIYVMNADGTSLIRLTDDPAKESNPVWSSDGRKIAFISNRDGYFNIYTMDAAGGEVNQITRFKANAEKPTWSPDGQFLAFASDMQGNRGIFITDIFGKGLLRISSSPPEDFYPAWSPAGENVNQVGQSPTLPPQFACRVSGDATYGYSQDNPIKLGFDPRLQQVKEEQCLTWLTGPKGESLQTEVLEELRVNDTSLCKVAVTYAGQDTPAILYFDLFNYQQPLAPRGFLCGSDIEYSKTISSGIQASSK